MWWLVWPVGIAYALVATGVFAKNREYKQTVYGSLFLALFWPVLAPFQFGLWIATDAAYERRHEEDHIN